jgi:hypothetical protein
MIAKVNVIAARTVIQILVNNGISFIGQRLFSFSGFFVSGSNYLYLTDISDLPKGSKSAEQSVMIF